MGLLRLLILVGVVVTVEGHEAAKVLRDLLTEPVPLGEAGEQCRRDSDAYEGALGRLEPWAMNMYDASSKIPSGYLTGNKVLLGQFDQCIAVKGPGFKGQYCSVLVAASVLSNVTVYPGNLKELVLSVEEALTNFDSHCFRWSLCVPSSCNGTDLKLGLSRLIESLNMSASGAALDVLDVSCTNAERQSKDAGDKAFLLLVSIIFLLNVAGTLYDLNFTNLSLEGQRWRRWRCLSLRANWLHLIDTRRQPGRVACLAGLRFLSISWIILAHTYYTIAVAPNISTLELQSWRFHLSRMPLMNATVATDTFFLLTGFLIAINFMKYCRINEETPKIYGFWISRYLRIAPAYAVIVFFYATHMRLLGDGPLWNKIVGTEVQHCRDNWWTNMLFVNNYVHVETQCLNQTWYLAVDFQLYLVLGPLMYLVWKLFEKPRLMGPILVGLLVAAVIIPTTITATEKLPGAMVYGADNNVMKVYQNMYIPVYTRAGPFLVGLGLGYITAYQGRQAITMSKVFIYFFWLCCCLFLGLTVFGGWGIYSLAPDVDVVQSSLFAGFQRTVWALAVAWIILACSNGFGGPVNYILSLPLMEPLGKLTYCIFLTHFIFVYYGVAKRRVPTAISDFLVLQSALGILLMSIFAATILYLFVEQPVNNLVKTLFSSRRGAEIVEIELESNSLQSERISPASNAQSEEYCFNEQNGDDTADEEGTEMAASECTASTTDS